MPDTIIIDSIVDPIDVSGLQRRYASFLSVKIILHPVYSFLAPGRNTTTWFEHCCSYVSQNSLILYKITGLFVMSDGILLAL